jgi:hypothetical protein
MTALSAVVGVVVLVGAAVAFPERIGPIEFFFLLAPLVVVPLGLAPVLRREPSPLLRLAAGLRPFGAGAAVASFAFEPGPTAAGLAAAWAGVTTILGLAGAVRLLRGQWRTIDELCVTAALCFIPVGGAWFVQSRAGLELLGFREPIILLTGVHFHYTAFAAPVLAAEIGRAIRPAGMEGLIAPHILRRLHAAGAIGLIVGTPLLAVGFTVSPALKLTAATVLVGSVAALALVQLAGASRCSAPGARTCVVLSSLAALVGLAAAFVYELGEFTGRGLLTIPQMAWLHGPTMGVGFVLCGLLGWSLAGETRRAP